MLIVFALAMNGAARGEAQTAYASLDQSVAAAIAEVEDYAEGLVRLHVIAEDDTPEAQALKLKVRDCVLDAVQPLVAECANAQSAFEILEENLKKIEAAAAARVRAEGFEGNVTAETGVFAFPDRTYGGVTVPAGDYRALRIVIGEGAGQNWWCVLFPGLCLPVEGERVSLIAQWLEGWLGGEGR